jgi:hypothetical protein
VLLLTENCQSIELPDDFSRHIYFFQEPPHFTCECRSFAPSPRGSMQSKRNGFECASTVESGSDRLKPRQTCQNSSLRSLTQMVRGEPPINCPLRRRRPERITASVYIARQNIAKESE